MKRSITGAVFALLLAVAAPFPVAESLTGQEQESAVDLSRPSRSGVRHSSQHRPREVGRVDVQPSPPEPLPCEFSLPVRFPEDAIPPTFCRPPPL